MQLLMRERKCDISGTRQNSKAMSVSKSNVHTHRVQGVNLQWCRLWWPEANKFVRVRISTRTLKTIKKYGLDCTARKYGVNLNRFSLSYGTSTNKRRNYIDIEYDKQLEQEELQRQIDSGTYTNSSAIPISTPVKVTALPS